MSSQNVARLLTSIVRELDVKVTQRGIVEELQRYPDPENLFAISDILSSWNIPNAAYQLSLDELKQGQVPLPFVASFRENPFALIYEINDDEVLTMSSATGNKIAVKIDEFNKYYSGAILAFQKDERSGELDYSTKRRKEIIENIRLPFVISATALLLCIFIVQSKSYLYVFDWRIACLAIFKVIGLLTSIILLAQSIDANNPFIKKVCGTDANKSCNAILLSDAAKVTDELSWSEVGFFYFAGSLLCLLLNGGDKNLLQYLSVLNALCLPYTVYSIYYQWRVAKQWCLFCCTIQAILWLEFIPSEQYLFSNILSIKVNTIINLVFGFALPVIIWVVLKPYLKLQALTNSLTSQLNRFKYNSRLFNALLYEETKYDVLDAEQSIILGNKESTQTVTIITNPTCRHCAKAHQALEEWLDTDEDNKLQVIFAVTNNKNSNQFKAARHLLYLKDISNATVKEAIGDWFGQRKKNYDDWSTKYPPINLIDLAEKNIEVHSQWCKTNNVISTPMILINGYILPSAYQPEDLRYILKN